MLGVNRSVNRERHLTENYWITNFAAITSNEFFSKNPIPVHCSEYTALFNTVRPMLEKENYSSTY